MWPNIKCNWLEEKWKKFAESSFDREILLGKTFAAKNQASNR